MDNFIISSIPELIFGVGTINGLKNIINARGFKDIVVITGGRSFLNSIYWKNLSDFFVAEEINFFHFKSTGETSPQIVDDIVSNLQNTNVDVVIAVGGGTVMDTGKAVSAMLCMEGSIVDYLEGVGSKDPTGERKPLICMPTTSGTGSEATKNAVITKTGKDGFKKSLRHKGYIPDTVIIDPELIKSCPLSITLSTGLDAVTQLLESYVSTKSTPFTDTLALHGLQLAGRSLPKLFKNINDMEARSEMAYAAYLSGITLANAGLGVIHGAASVLGGLKPIPHGVVCGTLLASATEIIISKLKESNDTDKQEYIRKYGEAGSALSGKQSHVSIDACSNLVDLLNEWIDKFNIPKLSEYNFTREDLITCSKITGLKNTPIQLEFKNIQNILLSRL